MEAASKDRMAWLITPRMPRRAATAARAMSRRCPAGTLENLSKARTPWHAPPMRLGVLIALAMFVATPITMLVNPRDAEAQVWKPRSQKKARGKAKAQPDAEPKAKTSSKSSRKAKAKAPARAKKKAAPTKKQKAKQPRKPAVDEDEDFAIFEETEGDLER